MVNNQNPYLTIFPELPLPPSVDAPDLADRKIADKPIWAISELISIVQAHSESSVTVRMVTDNAVFDYGVLVENGFDLKEVLFKVRQSGQYKGTWWCKTSATKDSQGRPRGKGFWVPCDAYVVICDYEHPATGYCGKAEYYLKMCKSADGSLVLFVSLHLSA